MSAGAVTDREVDHLGGENKRAHDAHQRNLVMVELALRAARNVRHRRRRDASIVPHTGMLRKPSGMCIAPPPESIVSR